VLSHLLDDADRLVAEDPPLLRPCHRPAHEVEIGPADPSGRDPDDGVRRLADLGLGNVVQPNVADAVVHDRFHPEPPFAIWPRSEDLNAAGRNTPG
jgi:hypothetical protein